MTLPWVDETVTSHAEWFERSRGVVASETLGEKGYCDRLGPEPIELHDASRLL